MNLEHRLGIPFPVPIEVTPDNTEGSAARPTLQARTDDDKVLETYIQQRKLTGYIEREAREVDALQDADQQQAVEEL